MNQSRRLQTLGSANRVEIQEIDQFILDGDLPEK